MDDLSMLCPQHPIIGGILPLFMMVPDLISMVNQDIIIRSTTLLIQTKEPLKSLFSVITVNIPDVLPSIKPLLKGTYASEHHNILWQ